MPNDKSTVRESRTDQTQTTPSVPHTCKHCEYFDDGGADELGHSDCLNRRSPRFQTYAHETCPVWTEASPYAED